MSKQLYAFWSYDLFPFCLGGEVTNVRLNGYVETREYGTGFYFKPFLLLPYAEGKKKAEALQKLSDEHHSAQQTLAATYLKKANEIVELPK
jgi:hypothetical protein